MFKCLKALTQMKKKKTRKNQAKLQRYRFFNSKQEALSEEFKSKFVVTGSGEFHHSGRLRKSAEIPLSTLMSP